MDGQNSDRFVQVLWGVAGIVFILGGLALLILSVWGYLKTGQWGAPSVADIAYAALYPQSADFKQQWIGLWRIFESIPLWIATLGLGWAFIALSANS